MRPVMAIIAFLERLVNTETWLHLKGDDVTIGELCLSVYRFVHTPDRRELVGV